jgi:hypothetical protein
METYFLLKCKGCKWWRRSNGLSSDLKDLHPIPNCPSCSGRKFKCPQCGQQVKMMRVKGSK